MSLQHHFHELHARLTGTVLGSELPSRLLVTALVADGHALIEGAPGIGKTTLAQCLADSVAGSFRRLQFTPDLLPADVTGYSIYHQGTGEFEFIPGPVFCNVLLADEINRSGPRIQSALLECMNEGQVSVDGVTRHLEPPFFVVATQNDLYAAGTFPLPEPQLDRFLLSVPMSLPPRETQIQILGHHLRAGAAGSDAPQQAPLLSLDQVRAAQREAKRVEVQTNMQRYLVEVAESVRSSSELRGSVSARAVLALMRAAQAMAWLEGRTSVYPDDVKGIAPYVLRHRAASSEFAGLDSQSAGGIIHRLIDEVPVP